MNSGHLNNSPVDFNTDGGEDNEEPSYDKRKYVSYAEYLRDVVALKNKWIKIAFILVVGIIISLVDIAVSTYVQQHPSEMFHIGEFHYDYILALFLVVFILVIPGIWIGVAKHKIYSLVYFGSFSIGAIIMMPFKSFFIHALYVFVTSFFLLIIVYIVFFKIWMSLKMNIAKARYD
ncbi:MAG: hypothetical protein ACTSRA_05665 [Promethearchaeota archaeon]